jgi:hypothetical protein
MFKEADRKSLNYLKNEQANRKPGKKQAKTGRLQD